MKRFLCVVLAFVITVGCVPCRAVESETAPFPDVPASYWFAPYVAVCAEKGIVRGDEHGLFLPWGWLDGQSALVMLMRLHSVLHGGDGQFPAPPADWLPTWVENEAGERLFTYRDYEGWNSSAARYDQLFFRTDRAETLAGTIGTVRLGARRFSGPFSVAEAREGQVMLDLSASGLTNQDKDDVAYGLYLAAPNRQFPWTRAAWYYAQQNGLDEAVHPTGCDAETFADALYQVCGGLLPKRFDAEYVPGYEREEYPAIYALREAGVWKEACETWNQWNPALPYSRKSFSRADAAVLMGRVLEPSLRLTEDPDALPHTGYTLTYLTNEPADGRESDCIYPVLPLKQGMWTLDGVLVPWPEEAGTPWLHECVQRGEYLHASFPAPASSRSSGSQGAAGCGGAAGCVSYVHGWFDADGQLVAPISQSYTPPDDPPEFERPYTPTEQGIYYDGEGRPVSQRFDWCGPLDQYLRGFVGLEGKIYRIQFDPLPKTA